MSTIKANYLVNAAGTGAPEFTNGLTSSGNVGIGTSSPAYKLDVSGSGQQAGRVVTTDTSGVNVGRLVAQYTGGGGGVASVVDMRAGDGYGAIVTSTNTPMFFAPNNTERMRIDSSGNVGIGTSSPGVLLDVRNGSNTGGSGTWLTKVHQNTNSSGANGLSVMNTWAASTSKVLELAVAWNGTTSGYYPIFQIDGINQRFSAIYGSGGSAAVATLYPEFQCRAWVNFNGTGTVAIRASGNVSSITDNGTGDFTVNFTTAMPDENFSAIGTTNSIQRPLAIALVATGSVRVQTASGGTTNPLTDFVYNNVAVFR